MTSTILTTRAQIIDKLGQFDWYVALSRGGLPVAGFLSYITGIKQIDTLNIWSYEDKSQGEIHFIDKDFGHIQAMRVLIIDDLVDSGKTLLEAKSHLESFGPSKIETFVMIKKTCTTVEPTFYLEEAEPDKWINFIWDDKSKNLLDLVIPQADDRN
ncbi:MAG: hypothetical protein H7230_00050 [Candidatus Parcubacteria bacterium]|nr:hypothetical protein [Candidatus Paceibacterota bacterium]